MDVGKPRSQACQPYQPYQHRPRPSLRAERLLPLVRGKSMRPPEREIKPSIVFVAMVGPSRRIAHLRLCSRLPRVLGYYLIVASLRMARIQHIETNKSIVGACILRSKGLVRLLSPIVATLLAQTLNFLTK